MTVEDPKHNGSQTTSDLEILNTAASLPGFVANLSAARPDPIEGESIEEYAHRAATMAKTLSLLGFDEM